MTELEIFQNVLLKKLGFDILPFYGDTMPKYVYFKDGKLVFLDSKAKESYRECAKIAGNVLLRYSKEGCYYCPSLSENGAPIHYHPRSLDSNWRYLILWENNEYTELDYLNGFELNPNDSFEYIDTDNYFAIKYHKENMSEQEKPFLDTIISKKNKIEHIEVFTCFVNDIIIVCGSEIIAYNQNFTVLYEKELCWGDFGIWECKDEDEQKIFLLFPSDGSVCCLSNTKSKERVLYEEKKYSWRSVKIYKDIFIFYSEKYEPSQYYEDDWSERSVPPIRNTVGHVFNSDFELIREFNVIGEITAIKEFGGTYVMKVISSTNEENDTEKYYNLRGANKVRHDAETDEDFSLPDIYCRSIGCDWLYLVRSKVAPSDFLDFENGTNIQGLTEKYGIYRKVPLEDVYVKVVDCKYDYIRSIFLEDDMNIYYAGFCNADESKKCDLYINNEMILREVLYSKGSSLRVLGNRTFISAKDPNGDTVIIRGGKIVFTTPYDVADIYTEKYINVGMTKYIDNARKITEYLIVVSYNDLYGIYSSSGKLLLPIKYSTIAIDEHLTIVLGKKIEDNSDFDEYYDPILNDELMEIGYYSSNEDTITHEMATVVDGVVCLDNDGDYIWNGDFKYTSRIRDDYSDYSYEDSIYDALGGEMSAIWNLD